MSRKMENYMTEAKPKYCAICHSDKNIRMAPFKQNYVQKDADPVIVDWWECPTCNGLFAYPVPTQEQIARHWLTVNYNQGDEVVDLHRAKEHILDKTLNELNRRTATGKLLDVGSNFGHFLVKAREKGWEGYGFEPCADGVTASQKMGFEVRSGWCLEDAAFDENTFQAVTAFDSFCYVWSPWDTLKEMFRILAPGGTLAMRLTNKRQVIGLAARLKPEGEQRNRFITPLLQNQFHSIYIRDLEQVMRDIGFQRPLIIRNATTAPWETMSAKSKFAYQITEFLYHLTFHSLLLSPGVLIFVSKPGIPDSTKR